MELDIQTLMMVFFIIFLIISIWKIYAFLPNEQLKDDDTTKESQDELIDLMLNIILQNSGKISVAELYEQMSNHDNFDKKHYWRFNQNRLNHLLGLYYVKYPHVNSIEDIYNHLKN